MYTSHVTCLQFSDIDYIHSDVCNKTRSVDTNVCGVNVLLFNAEILRVHLNASITIL